MLPHKKKFLICKNECSSGGGGGHGGGGGDGGGGLDDRFEQALVVCLCKQICRYQANLQPPPHPPPSPPQATATANQHHHHPTHQRDPLQEPLGRQGFGGTIVTGGWVYWRVSRVIAICIQIDDFGAHPGGSRLRDSEIVKTGPLPSIDKG